MYIYVCICMYVLFNCNDNTMQDVLTEESEGGGGGGERGEVGGGGGGKGGSGWGRGGGCVGGWVYFDFAYFFFSLVCQRNDFVIQNRLG